MNDEIQFAYKIRQLLSQGLRLKPGQSERLRAARERALAGQRVAEPAFAMLWSDGLAARLGGGPVFLSRIAVSVLFLVFGLVGITYWQKTQQAAEIEEIDAALLTSDLPLDAYLDKGFDTWLKRSSQ